ncbi:MAG: PRC-barrel domain-containing protein, partial [Betaproteobacteria bacterium]
MLRRIIGDLQGRPVMAADGFVGRVKDVYFDDRWTVRYVAIHIAEGHVLIPPQCLSGGRVGTDCIVLAISRAEVRNVTVDSGSPDAYKGAIMDRVGRAVADSRVRSACEVSGYWVAARDASIGCVEDFVVDDRTWCVTELVADTR